MKFFKIAFILFTFCCSVNTYSQNDRIKDGNDIFWAQIFTSIDISERWQISSEYQWRRVDNFAHWQQSLLRGAVQHKFNDRLSAAIGYAWIEAFKYGDFPLASNGTFPEHRIYQQLQLQTSFHKLTLTQRLRIEQRWIGRRQSNTDRVIEDWLFSHRFRVMARLQYPLLKDKKLYVALADEVFLGAGKNVGANTFDQNRIMLILGHRFNSSFSIEAGYINQTAFQGRRINDQLIVQDNNGFTFAVLINI